MMCAESTCAAAHRPGRTCSRDAEETLAAEETEPTEERARPTARRRRERADTCPDRTTRSPPNPDARPGAARKPATLRAVACLVPLLRHELDVLARRVREPADPHSEVLVDHDDFSVGDNL